MSTVTTRTRAGIVRGVHAHGVDRYLGVPYASAPVGELRFREAEPAVPWEGERDATRMGPTAPQNPLSPASAKYLPNVIAPGDDYLNANVWAPADAEGRPVMVWIHGGSLKHGSNAVDGYDGTAFARDGVVLVSINYRLGFEGFAVLDDAPLNVGYSDVVRALRWVQDEIAAFGGDPQRVTIFGESAGAVVVGNLLVGEHAGVLFHQAIVQSGMPAASTRTKAAVLTRSLARVLGVQPTRAAFSRVPVERMLEAEREVMSASSPRATGGGYTAVVGGLGVERDPMEAAMAGAGDRIPTVIGWTSEEHRFFRGAATAGMGPAKFAMLRLLYRAGRRVLQAYRRAYPGATREDVALAMTIDRILRLPMHRVADGRLARAAAPTWFYEFQWQSPIDDLGAAHAVELPFVFDTLASPDWTRFIGTEPPQHVADAMHAHWVRFATDGDPGWEVWDDDRPTMVYSGDGARVVDGPRDEQLAAWRGRDGDGRR